VPRNSREWIAVLWPAFVAACVLEIVVFAAFDPHDLNAFGLFVEVDRDTVYSVAFFAFWGITAATGLVTWSLSRTSDEINRFQRRVPVTLPLPGSPQNPDYRGPDPPPSVPPGGAA
jgi:H+/Cl- antiporter ClcA